MKHFILAITLLLTGCAHKKKVDETTTSLSQMDIPRLSCESPIPCNSFFTEHIKKTNSLWQPGSKTFFKDNRAWLVGDIVKVIVVIKDSASLNAINSVSHDMNANAGVTAQIPKADLSSNLNVGGLFDIFGKYKNNNSGTIDRKERITTQISAHVTELLPNGNLVICGHQEVQVNSELRDIKVAGVIRPKDITSQNSINLDQIAEARVSYGGRNSIKATDNLTTNTLYKNY